jgi:predicted NBD/HSP70 family sugar kinase
VKALRTTGKATAQGLRAENKRLLLQQISEGRGTVSRADLVRLAGLNTGTVSGVVTELLEQRLVREVGIGPSVGGKPPVLLDLDEELHAVLGLHLASGGYRIAAISLRGKIITQRDGPIQEDDVVGTLVAAVENLAADINRSVLAVGVAIPGTVDDEGLIDRSVSMHWSHLDLRRQMAGRLGYPVHLINDSNACALAEVTLTNETTPSLMALYVGDGVGAGLILQGALFQGDTFMAGEVGHLNLRTHTLQCECGRIGCLEASARLSVLTGRPQSLQLTERGASTLGLLDEKAAQLAAVNIAALLELTFELIDVHRVVICGPVCALGTELRDYVREALASHDFYMDGELTVENSVLGDNGPLLGAAASAAHKELGLLWSMVAQ